MGLPYITELWVYVCAYICIVPHTTCHLIADFTEEAQLRGPNSSPPSWARRDQEEAGEHTRLCERRDPRRMPTNPLSGKPSSSPTAMVPRRHRGRHLPSGLLLAFSLRFPPWMEHSRRADPRSRLSWGFADARATRPRVALGLKEQDPGFLGVCVFFLLFTCLLFLVLISSLLSIC